MRYTEQQNALLREQFAARRKRQWRVTIPTVAAMILGSLILGAIARASRPVGGLAPILFRGVGLSFVALFGLLLVGLMIFSMRNWRCPACSRSPGLYVNPKFCSNCGIELR